MAVEAEDGGPEPEGGASISAETIAYWAVVVAIYLGFGILWYYSAKEKLIDQSGTMPEGLAKGYAGSFVDSFPGLNATWTILGIVEAVAFLGVVASLLAGEFLPSRRKPILIASLGVSMFTFALLIFGQEMVGEYESVAELFGYFGATIVTLLLVSILPPRKGLWRVAGGTASEAR
ncbi:MAG: hypothetical protein BGO11_12805 [Solirubrobacterales bacterium 70-9]|nr:MAG: hypothetical protein BGO11_12805 [Solirubrobacterales bacterium 70-9]